MNRDIYRRAVILSMMIVCVLALLACDVASLVSQSKPPETQPLTTAPTVIPPTVAAVSSTSASAAARPTTNIVKVGQRVVLQGLAITVTKAQSADTLQGKLADAGYVWVVTTVTVENVSNDRVTVQEEQFDYVDKSGSVAQGMLNGSSSPGTLEKDVFAFHALIPGGKVENRVLPIQLKKELLSGLQLLFTIDKANILKWDLGL